MKLAIHTKHSTHKNQERIFEQILKHEKIHRLDNLLKNIVRF